MKALLALGFALVLLTLGSGCEENWQSFYIEEVKALSDPPDCIAPSVESATYMSRGTLDVFLSRSYDAALYVTNGLIPRNDPTLPVTESNGIFVQAAVVNIEPDPQCGVIPAVEFETTVAAFIEPSSAVTMGVLMVPASALLAAVPDLDPATGLPSPTGGGVSSCPFGKANITAVVQLFGVTQGNIDVATQQFTFPITVCAGCLLFYPPPLGTDLGDCEATSPAITAQPCEIGEDRRVDFRLVQPCV